MGYYNWREIIPYKTDSELKTIVKDRILSKEAIKIAENELNRRNDPQFIRKVEYFNSLHANWIIGTGIIYEGLCKSCKSHSHFLLTKEKGPRFQISMFFIELLGFPILFTGRELLNFLQIRKNRDGKVGTCLKCGSIMIKCKKCGNIQKLEGETQICSKCSRRIDNPENFHNPRN